MKKIISIILLCVMIFIPSACDKNEKSDINSNDLLDFNNDFQYYYSNINGLNLSITKSDFGYYIFLQNGLLCYIDKESMEATPLCNNVNCTHEDKNTCDAYFNTYSVPWSSGNTLQYNNGQIYILVRNEDRYGNFEGVSLYSVSADGSKQKELVSFKDGFANWIIHRGYFYYVKIDYSDDIESYSVEKPFKIYRLPIDNLKSEPQLVFDSGKYCDYVTGGVHPLLAYENYIMTTVSPISKNKINDINNGEEYVGADSRRYFTINTENLSVTEIINNDGEVNAPIFYNGKLLYHILKNNKFVYYTSELDGDNAELVKEMQYSDNVFSDGINLYMQNIDELFDEKIKNEKIYLLNSDLSKSGSASLPITKFSISNIPQDPDYFIFINYQQQENLSGDFEIRCIDKSQLKNSDTETIEYKTVYSSSRSTIDNKTAEPDDTLILDTEDKDLQNVFENAKNKCYKVSVSYDDNLSDTEAGGFSVKLKWAGDEGEYSADFQILKFNSDKYAKDFVKDNPYSFVNGQYVAFASVSSVPVEIKDMLESIIKNEPIDPINSSDFSGDIYTFS